MNPPAYHLRLNKAVDRFQLIDILRCFTKEELGKYLYVGLGGPFLEDFKLLDNFFPSLKKVSFEYDEQTFKRQKFNKPNRLVRLEQGDVVEGITTLCDSSQPMIVWFDSTQGLNQIVEGFIKLLGAVPDCSIVRVTMKIARKDDAQRRRLIESLTGALQGRLESVDIDEDERMQLVQDAERIVREQVENVMPSHLELQSILHYLPSNWRKTVEKKNGMVRVLLEAVHNAVIEQYPPNCGRRFRLLDASFYSDGTRMLSVTGALVSDGNEKAFMDRFKGTHFAMVKWTDEPQQIDMPVLTPKERLHLNSIVPVKHNPGNRLCGRLGFQVDSDAATSRAEMEMYNKFFRYYPMFARVAL